MAKKNKQQAIQNAISKNYSNNSVKNSTDLEIEKMQNSIENAIKINPELKKHLELNNYRIIFESYNNKYCQLSKFDKTLCESLINNLKEITKLSGRTIANTKFTSKKSIERCGNYKSLFDSVPEDVEIYHFDIGQKSRVFYYCVGNSFCLISFAYDHL